MSYNAEQARMANYVGFKLKDGNKKNIRTLEGALRYVRTHLMSMDIDQEIVNILFNITKQGITPNLVYDTDESKVQFDMVLKSVKPVKVKIKQGDVISGNNAKIDAETYEALVEYREALKRVDRLGYGFHKAFYHKTFFGSLVLVLTVLALRLFPPSKRPSLKTLASCGLLAIFELALLRGFIRFSDYEVIAKNFSLICALNLAPPTLCAAGMAMLIYGDVGGLVVSVVVSAYYTLMISQTMEFFCTILVASLIFVGLLKNVSFRSKIVRAGIFSGVCVSVIVFLGNLFPLADHKSILFKCGLSAIMCLTSGILTVALLPFFEKLFAVYSNITLLELTNYTNQVLKNLQISAPGTYNHSLMVANIAEQVAFQVNANSILCKTGALYHDIGKMLKAEYFIENQNNQINLHDQQTPYVSTLIIKNHVRYGVELAKEHKLPPAVIDMIQQHHGTTLIRYFYDKAKRDFLASVDASGMSNDEINALVADKVDASSFRYDGPRPKTKESLIIMLSDSIEAASRSMKRTTHQAIENLVNYVFDNKLSDHQLDECPVSFNEIRELKKAFIATVLAMMHTRIAYVQSGNADNDEMNLRND
jgi:putative nucleotidyltransferase with HDIG domain